jgi:hypothetical protein
VIRRSLAAVALALAPLALPVVAGAPPAAASGGQSFSVAAGCEGNGAAGTGEVLLSWQGLPAGPTVAAVEVSGGGLTDILHTYGWTARAGSGPQVEYLTDAFGAGSAYFFGFYAPPQPFHAGLTYHLTSTWTDGYGVHHASGDIAVTFSQCDSPAPLGILSAPVVAVVPSGDTGYTLVAANGESCGYQTGGAAPVSGACSVSYPSQAPTAAPPGAVGSRELATGAPLHAPIVATAAGSFPTVFTPATGEGTAGTDVDDTWSVAADGGVFTSTDAGYYGSLANTHLNAPIVGIAVTPNGRGYWLFGADGGVFAFGDAAYFGSLGGARLATTVVAAAAAVDGGGYTLVTAAGGVYTFGDAPFYGSLGATHLNAPITAFALATTYAAPGQQVENGYWLAGGDGGVFTFGAAPYYGSPA